MYLFALGLLSYYLCTTWPIGRCEFPWHRHSTTTSLARFSLLEAGWVITKAVDLNYLVLNFLPGEGGFETWELHKDLRDYKLARGN